MWTKIDPRKLKVGHYVRIHHSWLSHPFPRSTFTIASQSDLQLIHECGLKRVSFHPGRSTIVDKPKVIVDDPQQSASEPSPTATLATASEEPTRVKQRMVQEVQARRQRLESLSRHFVREAHQTAEATRLIDAGESGGFVLMEGLAAQAVRSSGAPTASLCFAGTALASAALDKESAATVTAMALAADLGRKLQLDDELICAVAVAAALRAIGMRRLPRAERGRSTLAALPHGTALRNYPQVSAGILQRLGKIPLSVLRIVAQHRECLDGSGFPRGLRGDAIASGAALVGLVHEYQELTAAGRQPQPLSPSEAVRHLYQTRREQFGMPMMNHFIATLSIYPPGTFVRLCDDTVAVVVRVNPTQRLRPTVLVLDDRNSLMEGDIADLAASEDRSIVSAFAASELPSQATAFAGLTDVAGLRFDTGTAPAAAG